MLSFRPDGPQINIAQSVVLIVGQLPRGFHVLLVIDVETVIGFDIVDHEIEGAVLIGLEQISLQVVLDLGVDIQHPLVSLGG